MANNLNPVISVARNGTVLYSNEAGKPLLHSGTWKLEKNYLQVISSLLDLQAEQFKSRKDIRDSEVLGAFRESQTGSYQWL